MCTAVYLNDSGLFGRTLDYENGFGEEVIVTPRNYMTMGEAKNRYAMIGAAVAREKNVFYFDGMNEWGLCGGALNFPGYAVYHGATDKKTAIPSGILLSFVLGFCKSVGEVRELFRNVGIVGEEIFGLPPTPLHWIFADKREAITIESTDRGLEIIDNPYGVLTNSPNFSYHTTRLGDYMALHSGVPENRGEKERRVYSRGMGAIGLPGDFSSVSRFVRGVFVKENSLPDSGKRGSVNRMRHILSSVSIPLGCVRTSKGEAVSTRYTSIMDSEKLTYYFYSYEDPCLREICLQPEMTEVVTFPIYE